MYVQVENILRDRRNEEEPENATEKTQDGRKKSWEFSVLEPREECVLWRAREVAAQVLLDGQVNQDLTTGFFNVKIFGDSNKNLFSGSGRGTNVTGNSSRQGEERIWSI